MADKVWEPDPDAIERRTKKDQADAENRLRKQEAVNIPPPQTLHQAQSVALAKARGAIN